MKNPVAGTFRSLRSFNFRLWTAGALVSNVGTWMQRVAQDWLVLTQLTHHDASALGIVMGLQFAPQLLLLPWTGSAADRLNQRKLLMLTQATMGVLALVLGVLTIAGVIRLWHVYVFAFLSGSAAALDAPVRQTFVAEMVGDAGSPQCRRIELNLVQCCPDDRSRRRRFAHRRGWHRLGLSSKRALIRGGADLDVFLSSLRAARKRQGASHCIWISGRISLRVEKTGPPSDPDHAVSDRHLWIELSDLHLDHGRERLPLRRTCFRPALLHHGRRHSLRSLVCSRPAETRLGIPFGRSRCLRAGLYSGRTRAWILVVCGGSRVIGAAALTFTNGTNSIMQLSTEPAMRGRVMALRVGIALGGTPIGAPIVGWVANHFGPRWALGVGAGAGFTAALVAACVLGRLKEPLLAQ